MSDILIHKNGRPGGRAVVIPLSGKGITWLRDQIYSGSTQYSIDGEATDEYVKVLQVAGLEVDER